MGVKLDSNLTLNGHVSTRFNYCPLLWMFGSRTLNNKINKLHERALRVVYKSDNLTFQQLLEKNKSFTIHESNLQMLAVEMYDVNNKISPLPVQYSKFHGNSAQKEWEVPRVRQQWDRIYKILRTVNNRTESIRYRGLSRMEPNL